VAEVRLAAWPRGAAREILDADFHPEREEHGMAWLLSREPMTLWEITGCARKALRGEEGSGGSPPAVHGAAGGQARGPATRAAVSALEGDRSQR
jgi:hypothetical protein